MNGRMLENAGTLTADRGDTWRAVWLREGLAGPARLPASLLVEPDADGDGGDPHRPWFPDYEEVE